MKKTLNFRKLFKRRLRLSSDFQAGHLFTDVSKYRSSLKPNKKIFIRL